MSGTGGPVVIDRRTAQAALVAVARAIREHVLHRHPVPAALTDADNTLTAALGGESRCPAEGLTTSEAAELLQISRRRARELAPTAGATRHSSGWLWSADNVAAADHERNHRR